MGSTQHHAQPSGVHPVSTRGALDHVSVQEVMTPAVICVRPKMRAGDLRALLLERNIGGAPVVDEEGTAIGVVSMTDLVRDTVIGVGEALVEDLMTELPIAVPQTTALARAIALMAYENVHRLLVLSPERRVVGILSAMDIMRFIARSEGYAVPAHQVRVGVIQENAPT
jgi:predicted transcriptional regulator